MAKIYKRGNAWTIDYQDPDKKRVRKGGFKTRKAAADELAQRQVYIREGIYFVKKAEHQHTLGELMEWYADFYKHQASWHNSKKFHVQKIIDRFGADTLLKDIDYSALMDWQNHLLHKDLNRHGRKYSKATVNKIISALRQALSKAQEKSWIKENPFSRGESLMINENNAKNRYLTHEEAARLLAECRPHLKNIIVCALNTGMRRGEILNLKWEDIRGDHIYLYKTKTDTARQVPINATLRNLFDEILKNQQLKSPYVFTYHGEPVLEVKRSFESACKRAEITGTTFHTLRHTFASWLVIAGTPILVVQKLLGHKTLDMTLRYAHLAPDMQKEAVERLGNMFPGPDTKKTNCHVFVTNS